ncbi:glycoside hydrolase family 43 protein [Xylariomycetidae sp. FL2044]|nr:glycoside hydrolase family 43 protein [Xylariomycetidae sp. FL2044]
MKTKAMQSLSLLALTTLLSSVANCLPANATDGNELIDKRGDDFKYVFATFTATDQQGPKEVTHMDIHTSKDGYNFDVYKLDAYKPKEGLVRDPSIIKLDDTYYIAHTVGWTGSKLGIIKSKNLKEWEAVTTIDTTTKERNVVVAWAPEWFKDKDGSIHLIASLQPADKSFSANPNHLKVPEPMRPSILHSQSDDMSKWSEPEDMDVKNTGEGARQGHIDMQVFYADKDGEYKYHAFQKNNVEEHLEQLRAKELKGPWEYMKGFTNDWAGWGKMEGPSIVKAPDGKWILWMDNMKGNFAYAETSDINDPKQWSKAKSMPKHSSTFRHGTVIKVD